MSLPPPPLLFPPWPPPPNSPEPGCACPPPPAPASSTASSIGHPAPEGRGAGEGAAGCLATAAAFSPLVAHRLLEFVSGSLPRGPWQQAAVHALPPVAMLSVSILLWRKVGPLPGEERGGRCSCTLAVAAGLLLGAVAAMANLLTMLARTESGGAAGTLLDPSAAALVIHVAVLAPIAEEAAFRGLIYRQLRQSMSVLPTVVLSAMVFSMMHASLSQAGWAFALGVITAVAYEQTRALLAPILVHALFNAVPIGMAMARSRPDDVGPIWLVLGCLGLVFVWAARAAERATA